MNKNIWRVLILIVIFVLILLFFPFNIAARWSQQVSAVFFTDSITADDLRERYKNGDPIRILVVPGHDSSSYGTIDSGVRELDLNLELGQILTDKIATDDKFYVVLAQTKNGYLPEIKDYFEDKKNIIWDFRNLKKSIMDKLVSEKKVTRESIVDHISASNDTASKLYGLNHWSTNNNIDLIIHIHFNDYPGRRSHPVPIYSGFSLYLPEQQYSNSKASWAIGRYIASSLETKLSPSNHPLESNILIPDQELIAIGAFNTLDAASVLIEYGYIYEPNYAPASPAERTRNLSLLASLTYEGLNNFFNEN